MKHLFPSDGWIDAYRESLNACAEYREAAATWDHGAIALAVAPAPELGLAEGFGVRLDLERGRCLAARRVSLDESRAAPFCITTSYERWREVLTGRLDPLAGMITRRLELRGNLLVLLRYVRSSKAMVACAARVPVEFREPFDSQGRRAALLAQDERRS